MNGAIEYSRRLSILIVEDHLDTLESTVLLVEMFGYLPRGARNGRAALAAIACEVPDVVILDLVLPDVNGIELGRQILDLCKDKPPFLIAITGFPRQDFQAKVESAGFHLFMNKPVDPPFLRQMLRNLEYTVGDENSPTTSSCQRQLG